MKKILSLITAPFLAVIMLLGCTPVVRTIDDVENNFNAYMDSYIKNNKNDVFKNNVYAFGTENDEGDLRLEETEDGEVAVKTYEKILYLVYSSANGLNNAINGIDIIGLDETLKIQYSQLKTVYQRILSVIFNYYANWSSSFYENIAHGNFTEEDIRELYNSVTEIKKATDELVAQKYLLETIVSQSSLQSAGSAINNYNSKLNQLIIKSFNFINYYKDLHKKHLFNLDIINPASAQRIVDEALILVAEAVFYDNVYVLDRYGKTEIHRLENPSLELKDKPNVWITKPQWAGITFTHEDGSLYANSNLNVVIDEDTNITIYDVLVADDEENEELKAKAEALIKQLKYYSESFEQNLKYYKQIHSKIDTLNYNYYREFVSAPQSFNYENLSPSEKNNIQFLLNFSISRINSMFEAIYKVVAA